MSAKVVKKIKYDLIGGGLPLGCKVKDGKILPALSAGPSDYSCPIGVKYAAYIHYSNKICVITKSALFMAVEGENYKFFSAADATLPFVIEYKSGAQPASIAITNNQYYQFRGDSGIIDKTKNNICGGVYKNGRVFAIDVSDRYKLRWSGEKGIFDWEEKIDGAGWLYTDIELGEINNLAVFKDDIAVIKQHGITLINVGGAPEDFKETVTVLTPPIYQNCSVVCGNKLYFYTSNGLYTFNGTAVEKVNIDGVNQLTAGVYAMACGSRLFFAGTHKSLGRGVILVYDTAEKTSYFIDVPTTAMVSGKYLHAYTQRAAVRLEEGISYTYQSEEFGHFSKRKKTLESIFLDCDTVVDVTVSTESGSRLFKGVKGKIHTHTRGAFFKVTVSGTNAEIRQLTASVEYY